MLVKDVHSIYRSFVEVKDDGSIVDNYGHVWIRDEDRDVCGFRAYSLMTENNEVWSTVHLGRKHWDRIIAGSEAMARPMTVKELRYETLTFSRELQKVAMNIKKNPLVKLSKWKFCTGLLGFYCAHCESAYHACQWYCRETDDFHETRVRCPGCGRHLVLRVRSVMSYIRNEWNPNKHKGDRMFYCTRSS